MNENTKTLSDLGDPIATARSAEIYRWDQDKVLKLFYPKICKQAARWEYTNAKEANEVGGADVVTRSEVLVNDRYGIIMDRIDGTTLTVNIEKNPLRVFAYANRFAKLHAHMHATKTESLRDIRQIIIDYLNSKTMCFLSSYQKRRVEMYLASLPAGNSLLHMDYHTDNVMVSNHNDIPIDWATGAKGDPAADLAMTYFLFNEAELYPGISRFQVVLYNLFRKMIYKQYIKRYLRLTNLSASELNSRIEQWYLAVLIARLVTCEAPTEVAVLQASILSLIEALPQLGHIDNQQSILLSDPINEGA